MVSARAKRQDLVIMKNGDRLTGQVKKLENGILYFKVDYVADSIRLDWLQVETVKSSAAFHIVLKDGSHLAGTITKVPPKEAPGRDFEVLADRQTVATPGADVINIATKKRNFWRQLVGSVDFGSDFTSGNNQVSLTSDASASYTAIHWSAATSFTSSFSGQSNGSRTNLLELSGQAQRFLNRNSSALGLVDFMHSSQQDLQLRSTLGGGYSRYLFRTNQNSLRWILGAVYTNESFVSKTASPTDQNLESLLAGEYQLFRFSRYNLQSRLFVFPGLSDAGRVRTTTKTTLNVKLPNNFYTNLSFWDNYDSRPPVNAKKNELGISSGIGWSF
jgi:putative salt-induced outer membrane protein YdiY